ncbi:restriction endonuclease subunit S [Amycolatopsis panacis]|uniref:Restriction endonuclease subunit S n=1 Tax=Amycolatopsis panacis TaxID=2340917 RepID=A0A419HXW9_9PSEU|nr:restriction endonuclease subunit S [Amycolatopsis panacis]RJQ81918.1 restriction endonuclease subunit S [Amycolatopsis panacis]
MNSIGEIRDLVDPSPDLLSARTPPEFVFKYIDLGSVDRGSINWPAVGRFSFRSAPSRARRLVRRGDILYGTVRPALCSHAYVDTDETCVASTGFAVLRSNSRSHSRYIYHLIMSDIVKRESRKFEAGSNYPAVNESDVLRYSVPVPSLDKQRKIADILDAVDESIRSTERMIAKLEQAKQGLLNNLLSFESAQEDWRLLTLGQLTTKIVDGVHATPRYVEKGVPFVTVENLTRTRGISLSPCRYITASDHRAFSVRADPRPGDVLVSKDGTLGVARVVGKQHGAFSIFVSVAMLRPRPTVVMPEFIALFFVSEYFYRQLGSQSSGSGLKHIHLNQFRNLELPVPSINEQRRIMSILGAADDRIIAEMHDLTKLRRLKLGLMRDLLTGRVRVKV